MRAGSHALTLLATPLNVHALRALEEQPMSLVDLRRALGAPPQTTMRGHLKGLAELEVVKTAHHNGSGGRAECELGDSGRALLDVAEIVDRWLVLSPEGPLELGTQAAKSSIKALVDGWDTAIIRVLAARPSALTELNKLLTRVSYPSLERRLTAMRLAGQLKPAGRPGRGNPYTVTEWLRRAVIPLAAAARWEREHLRDRTRPMSRLDIEATFLLALPLAELDPGLDGIVRVAVDLNRTGDYCIVGVDARLAAGRVVACQSTLRDPADAFVTGLEAAWLRALLDGDPDDLDLGGDIELGRGLATAIHGALTGAVRVR